MAARIFPCRLGAQFQPSPDLTRGLHSEATSFVLRPMHHVGTQILGMLFCLSEVGLSLFKRSGKQAKSEDGGSLRLLWITIMLSLISGYVAARFLPQLNLPGREICYTIGLVLCLLGLALRWYAILYLGRFFTVNVAISVDHRVVDTGPYRYVRHPSYTGALLAFTGLALCSANAAALVLIVLPITWAFFRRIQWEETALRRSLGQAYVTYAARTKRLIPGVF